METETKQKKAPKGGVKPAVATEKRPGPGRPYPDNYKTKKPVSFRLPPDLYEEAKQFAEYDNREIGNLVETALWAYLRSNTPAKKMARG